MGAVCKPIDRNAHWQRIEFCPSIEVRSPELPGCRHQYTPRGL